MSTEWVGRAVSAACVRAWPLKIEDGRANKLNSPASVNVMLRRRRAYA